MVKLRLNIAFLLVLAVFSVDNFLIIIILLLEFAFQQKSTFQAKIYSLKLFIS